MQYNNAHKQKRSETESDYYNKSKNVNYLSWSLENTAGVVAKTVKVIPSSIITDVHRSPMATHPPLAGPRNIRNEALPHIALIFCILRT